MSRRSVAGRCLLLFLMGWPALPQELRAHETQVTLTAQVAQQGQEKQQGHERQEAQQAQERPLGREARVRVRFDTDAGLIEFELYPERAPVTVANFLRHVDAGFYDGGRFYRVVRLDNQPHSPVKIEVIQGGLGLGAYDDAIEPPFSPITHETTAASGLKHLDGTLSMARLAPGSATSEFFVCVGDQPSLDFGGARNPDGQGFAAFGRVIEGMAVVREIQAGVTGTAAPDDLQAIRGQVLDAPVSIRRAVRIR